MIKPLWMTLVLLLCRVSLARDATTHSTKCTSTTVTLTKFTLVQHGYTSVVPLSLSGPLQIKADTSQQSKIPGLIVLRGNVTLTALSPKGKLTLSADQAIVEPKFVEVQVPGIHVTIDGTNDNIIQALSQCLKAFPTASAFRMTWSDAMFSSSVEATSLYQRRAHRMLQFSLSGTQGMGFDITQCVYTNVKDSTIHHLATAKDKTSTLAAFGAALHTTRHVHYNK